MTFAGHYHIIIAEQSYFHGMVRRLRKKCRPACNMICLCFFSPEGTTHAANFYNNFVHWNAKNSCYKNLCFRRILCSAEDVHFVLLTRYTQTDL